MMLQIIPSLVIAVATVACAAKYDNLKWQNDVYTGRHLDNLITLSTATDGYITNPTVLFLYAPECLVKAQRLVDLVKHEGPSEPFLTILKHDYETVRKHIWYDLDATDDLKGRYMTSNDTCLKILFFQAGFYNTNPFTWSDDNHQSFLEWIWSFMRVNIDIKNSLPEEISVSSGRKEISIIIGAGQQAQVQTYFTKSLTFYFQNSTPIYAIPVTTGLSTSKWFLDIDKYIIKNFDFKTWVRNNKDSEKKRFDHNKFKHWQMAEAELITFKQPLLVEHFTENGYEKIKIPDDVYTELRSFYDDNQDLRISESAWDDMEPAINTYTVQTTMVPLSGEIRESVGNALHDVMEDWCDCKLENTAFYGIREYYHGNVLRMHVDNVDTHIISAILLIHQQLNGGDSWKLEVIDYNGQRQQVTLEEGEMLLYESGTLIHGRPLPYEGTIFANCFLHYKPLDGWKWHRYYEQGNPIITDGSQKEAVDVIDTPLTLRNEFKLQKEEL